MAKAADIQNIGKVIGLSFKGDNQNKLSILSQTKRVEEESVLMFVEVEGGVKDVVVLGESRWRWGVREVGVNDEVVNLECAGIEGSRETDGGEEVGGRKTALHFRFSRN